MEDFISFIFSMAFPGIIFLIVFASVRQAKRQRDEENAKQTVRRERPAVTPGQPRRSYEAPQMESYIPRETTPSRPLPEKYEPVKTTVYTSVHEKGKFEDHCEDHAPVESSEGLEGAEGESSKDRQARIERRKAFKERQRAVLTRYDEKAAVQKHGGVLAFDRQSIVNGFVYSEILGKPKGRRQ